VRPFLVSIRAPHTPRPRQFPEQVNRLSWSLDHPSCQDGIAKLCKEAPGSLVKLVNHQLAAGGAKLAAPRFSGFNKSTADPQAPAMAGNVKIINEATFLRDKEFESRRFTHGGVDKADDLALFDSHENGGVFVGQQTFKVVKPARLVTRVPKSPGKRRTMQAVKLRKLIANSFNVSPGHVPDFYMR
jgi:hypothetical protein